VRCCSPPLSIQGANPLTLLARAVGPGLEPYGVPLSATLGDPRLTVLNGSNATVVSNNNWSQGGALGQGAVLTAAFPAAGAFSLKSGTNDAALVAALAAGSYTLQADAAPVLQPGHGPDRGRGRAKPDRVWFSSKSTRCRDAGHRPPDQPLVPQFQAPGGATTSSPQPGRPDASSEP
jgi:hypothetical protein